MNSTAEVLYLDKPVDCKQVLLKVVRVILRHGDRSLDTYALLDDGSERTMLLPAAMERLGLNGTPEDLSQNNQAGRADTEGSVCVVLRVPSISAKATLPDRRSLHLESPGAR